MMIMFGRSKHCGCLEAIEARIQNKYVVEWIAVQVSKETFDFDVPKDCKTVAVESYRTNSFGSVYLFLSPRKFFLSPLDHFDAFESLFLRRRSFADYHRPYSRIILYKTKVRPSRPKIPPWCRPFFLRKRTPLHWMCQRREKEWKNRIFGGLLLAVTHIATSANQNLQSIAKMAQFHSTVQHGKDIPGRCPQFCIGIIHQLANSALLYRISEFENRIWRENPKLPPTEMT
jgi:hypothetical protein